MCKRPDRREQSSLEEDWAHDFTNSLRYGGELQAGKQVASVDR